MATTAIKQLVERAQRMENTIKKRRIEETITMEKVVGFGTAGVTSVLAGYVDGRFDLSDGEAGDGTKLMGIPVMPVAAGLLAVGGLAVGGKVGSALAFSGLGAGCGWAYKMASNAGAKGAQ